VAFSGGDAELAAALELGAQANRADGPIAYTGTISGFHGSAPDNETLDAGDTVYLPGLDPGSATGVYAGDDSGGILTVKQGALIVEELSFAGDYTNAKFLLSPDPSGIGTDITEAPCFVEGTRILTSQGEVPVEALQPGDLVVTRSGELMPVAWLGWARVDCRRHPNPKLVWPVRISAGAIADGIPDQDLWLSPDHAIFLEGVLIPVKHLLNRTTITQMHTDSVAYWHVELPVHAVIFAQSLPSESYLDTGNRTQFTNGDTYLVLHPDFSARHWDDACAPLCTHGPLLKTARSRLRQRIIDASPIRVRACQRIIAPAVAKGRTFRFLLPPGTREVEILSSYFPSDNGMLRSQAYRVCISGIVVNGRVLALDDPALCKGFHPIEHHASSSWLWVGASAQLLLPMTNRHTGPIILDLLVHKALRVYPRS
ncbi:MAG TPA: Hint domain-containing protein, partial [Terriglobales bacterium]|nr:Hint domain-containing protein [Terriglobales bacterium]